MAAVKHASLKGYLCLHEIKTHIFNGFSIQTLVMEQNGIAEINGRTLK